ncbi:MAG: hypothetical protein HYY65_06855 [Candidatus Tectomicrobia bacterium]|uniref:Uncharacterized protein n=1 Tax=Tectimicrobiota bacterium TaxID=2528274 RepID=A0A932GP61_UNCTE|nr:hypothetical protein [Candidatus Tectomicrobia bacterium]
MKRYDPERGPDADDWLGVGEGERIELVESYHRRKRIRLPNARLHAGMHVIVENQLALVETVVVDTLARLQEEGLSRHDAVHAIASVLSEHLQHLLGGKVTGSDIERHKPYFDRLKTFTADDWWKLR